MQYFKCEKNTNYYANICFLWARKLFNLAPNIFWRLFWNVDEVWKEFMPFYSQARGDLEIQRFLGIILKTKQVSSVSNKGLFNFQRVVITFYFRHSKKRKPRNTMPLVLPIYFYECMVLFLNTFVSCLQHKLSAPLTKIQ